MNPSKNEISKVMSYLAKIKSEKRTIARANNGRSTRTHFHKFSDRVKCDICGKYLSQFGGRDPNGGLSSIY